MSDMQTVVTEQKQILELMPKVMAEIGAIPKTRRNVNQNYPFRGIEDVLAALHPVLTKYGIMLEPQMTFHRNETVQEPAAPGRGPRTIFRSFVGMELTFTAPDGSTATFSMPGEGQDFGGDKATAKAESMAYKYAILLGFAVPVDERGIEDGDRDESQAPPPPRSPAPLMVPPTTPPTAPHPGGQTSVQEQHVRILNLATEAKVSGEELVDAVKRRGAESVNGLSYASANDLIAALEGRVTNKQAKEVF